MTSQSVRIASRNCFSPWNCQENNLIMIIKTIPEFVFSQMCQVIPDGMEWALLQKVLLFGVFLRKTIVCTRGFQSFLQKCKVMTSTASNHISMGMQLFLWN